MYVPPGTLTKRPSDDGLSDGGGSDDEAKDEDAAEGGNQGHGDQPLTHATSAGSESKRTIPSTLY